MKIIKKLKIGEDFHLPMETITQTIVVYGGKGMGKTNFGAGVLPEELNKKGLKFSILDPVGVSWGIQHGSTRAKRGLKVLVLGGINGDIPIEPTAGAIVADLVVDEVVSTVIDISRRAGGRMWSHGEKIRFIADYCTRLYERQGERRQPIMQIIDEAGRFCPQQIPHGAPDIARCVGAIEQMVEMGRNVGIGVTLITQRSARMNKSVSELAECMIAFRTVGPRSVAAITDWLGAHVEKAKNKDIVEKLRSLPRGSALLISPGWLQYEGVVMIRKRETFDSSKTPEHGNRRRVPGKARKPDLKKYESRMAETIEKAKASDPAALRAEVFRLKHQIENTKRPVKAEPKTPKIAEVPVLKGRELKRVEKITEKVAILGKKLTEAVVVLQKIVEKRMGAKVKLFPRFVEDPHAVKNRSELKVPPSPPSSDEGDTSNGLRRGERKMLEVLARKAPVKLTKTQLGTLCGLTSSGGTFLNYFGRIKKSQFIVIGGDGLVQLTESGFDKSGIAAVGPLSAEETINMWRQRLRAGERRILDTLLDAHPSSLTREELGKRTGIIHTGGTFGNYLGTLRRNGLAEVNGQEVKAGEALFV